MLLLILLVIFFTVYMAAKLGTTVVMEEYKKEFSKILVAELNRDKFPTSKPLARDESELRAYLEDLGLTVLSYQGDVTSYEMTEEIASQVQHADSFWYWLHQYEGDEINNYLGKVITEHKFEIKGHPDEQLCEADSSDVWLFTVEDKIIGGYTIPKTNEEYDGEIFFLKK